MSKIITYKGKLAIGQQEKLRLSTNDGLTGYRINKFQIMPQDPMKSSVGDTSLIAKIYLTDQTGSITDSVDFSETDLLAVAVYEGSASHNPESQYVIFDKETFNQDIFIYIVDPDGATGPGNYYIELEQFKLDINTSTYHTLKNIRSRKQ